MIDWTVYLHLLTAPILISWALCGGHRTLPSKAKPLDALVWDAYVAARQGHRALPRREDPLIRRRTTMRIYRRLRTRPSRHSLEYFAARDTDTAELPAIRSDQ